MRAEDHRSTFAAWRGMTTTDWREALGSLAITVHPAMLQTSNARDLVAHLIERAETRLGAELDAAVNAYVRCTTTECTALGYALARTESADIRDLDGWLERAVAFADLTTRPVGRDHDA